MMRCGCCCGWWRGGYLVYLSYKLLSAQLAGNTGMSSAVTWISVCVLGVGGLAFCAWSALQFRRSRKAAEEEQDASEVEQ